MKPPTDKKSCRNPLVGDKREKELEKNAVRSHRLGGHDKYVIESVASHCRTRRDSALPLDVRHIPKVEVKENYADGARSVRGIGYALHGTPSHAIMSANHCYEGGEC